MARSRKLTLVKVVLGALVVPAFVACNSIIGLDEFQRAQCDGYRCGDGSDVDVVDGNVGDGSTLDGNTDAGKGTNPVSWARFHMPNYLAPDGSPQPPRPLAFTNNGADIVTETISGLVWRRAPTTTPSDPTASEAVAACAALDPATGPWRLPKRIELVTLIDYGLTGGSLINATSFPTVANAKVWTSSEVLKIDGTSDGRNWTVDFGSGDVAPLAATLHAKALCILGK